MPFMRESVHRPAGRCDRVYKRGKRIHAGRMRFPRPQYRDNDRSGYKPVRAQFERIACPVAQEIIKFQVLMHPENPAIGALHTFLSIRKTCDLFVLYLVVFTR